MARQQHRHLEGTKRYSLNIEPAFTRTSSATEPSSLFPNGLKKMDGVRGIGSTEATTFGYESLGDQVSRLCEKLRTIVTIPHQNGTVNNQPDPRFSLLPETREFLIDWLTGDPRGSPHGSQLQRDRTTLMQQVQQLEEQLELMRCEREALRNSVMELHKKNGHERSRSGSFGSGSVVTSNQTDVKRYSLTRIVAAPGLQRTGSFRRNTQTRRSYRESFSKKFGRKKTNGKDHKKDNDDASNKRNSRTVRFYSLSGQELTDWLGDIGLEMYGEIISQMVQTGERLASICSNTEDLVRLGVLNALHCKKLQLAVEDEMADVPSPLASLDHHWVSDWLSDVGLAQYQQRFMEARVDARMLNAITMEELALLQVTHPFHLTSMHRAIQAFRACGYDGNYMKIRPEKGSYKLVQWSVHHVMEWLREIELDEFADRLQGTGVSGPVIALESHFTHESLSKALGINPNKSLLMQYLGEKFAFIIGPICAQKKVDVMHQKHFVAIDPMEQPKKHKNASKKKSDKGADDLLCPLTDLPIITVVTRPASRVAVVPDGDLHRYGCGIMPESGLSAGHWSRSMALSPSPPQLSQLQPTPPPPPPPPLQQQPYFQQLSDPMGIPAPATVHVAVPSGPRTVVPVPPPPPPPFPPQ